METGNSADTMTFLAQGLESIGIHAIGSSGITRSTSDSMVMELSESDGVLRWELPTDEGTSRSHSDWKLVDEYQFARIPASSISARLTELDASLNPSPGLFEYSMEDESLKPAGPVSSGRILLFIHGTFTNSENFFASVKSTPHGSEFLRWALTNGGYNQVLWFSHPTVSVSPLINAIELSTQLEGCFADLDIVCHSRGGLVTRWWVERLRPHTIGRTKVIFVGAPLSGTSLASPRHLRDALDLMANFARAIAANSAMNAAMTPVAAPYFQVSATIASIFASLLTPAAKLPILDALVAMIPGISGQAREGQNQELLQLRRSFEATRSLTRYKDQLANYAFVSSDFKSEDNGWRFWKAFTSSGLTAAEAGARIVFESANDLVVDTESMCELSDHVLDSQAGTSHLVFGEGDRVHHCDYFFREELYSFICNFLSQEP